MLNQNTTKNSKSADHEIYLQSIYQAELDEALFYKAKPQPAQILLNAETMDFIEASYFPFGDLGQHIQSDDFSSVLGVFTDVQASDAEVALDVSVMCLGARYSDICEDEAALKALNCLRDIAQMVFEGLKTHVRYSKQSLGYKYTGRAKGAFNFTRLDVYYSELKQSSLC